MKPEGMSQTAWENLHKIAVRLSIKYHDQLMLRRIEREENEKKERDFIGKR